MSKNILTVMTNGISRDHDYVSILREHEDELAACGVAYEEHDRRSEPVTATLLISLILTTGITTAVSEAVKKAISRLCDRAKNQATPAITININATTYVLPKDQGPVIKCIEDLRGQ